MNDIFDTKLQGLLAKASKVEYSSETLMYIGYTKGDISDSSSAWAICKVESSATGGYPRTKTITWAEGRQPNEVKKLIWDLRGSYDYSY